LDFRDGPEEAAFREKLHGWLIEQKGRFPTSGDEYWAKAGEWHQALYAAGFFGTSWPKAYGGRELPPVYDVIVDEEIAKVGAPARPSLGYLVVGLSHHGSEELRQRFLPGMINGTERWCQGFSEPGAGSDLASLTTTATREGDEYVIHGHKIWTSYSDVADWCLVLARTDKGVPKHKGISAFIVPMHQPGIVQRPLKMISGVTKEFGQVEFDGARVSADNIVGAPGDGWKLAMTVVSHEREPSTLGFSARYGKTVRQLAKRVEGPPPEELSDMPRLRPSVRATPSSSAPTCTAARRASWAARRRFRRTSSRSGSWDWECRSRNVRNARRNHGRSRRRAAHHHAQPAR
jgi:alkylation response protein AidB-like acyl-CoA dehydrogenase